MNHTSCVKSYEYGDRANFRSYMFQTRDCNRSLGLRRGRLMMMMMICGLFQTLKMWSDRNFSQG